MKKKFADVTVDSEDLGDISLNDLLELVDKEIEIRIDAQVEAATASGGELARSKLKDLYYTVIASVIADVDALFGSK